MIKINFLEIFTKQYVMKRSTLTRSGGETGQLSRAHSTSRDSPIHYLSTLL